MHPWENEQGNIPRGQMKADRWVGQGIQSTASVGGLGFLSMGIWYMLWTSDPSRLFPILSFFKWNTL